MYVIVLYYNDNKEIVGYKPTREEAEEWLATDRKYNNTKYTDYEIIKVDLL